jgi:predicted HTH transcriptional regulator
MLQEILNALEDRKGHTVDEIGLANSLSENETKILGLIRLDRHMSAKRLAEEIGASPRQIERILAGLKERSIIRRVGANRNGYWEVIG